ncbi:MAG: CoA transferase [bacterium]|nr:CoA transferase [bacterium]
MPGPLHGVRVVEMTSTVSGPMAAMVLADQGADVIKVEPPMFGDTCRYLGSARGGMGGMYAVLNRNKRAVALDLKDETQKAVLLDLIRTADVLLENYRPGVLDRQGLGYEALAAINPGLVYVSVTGYGQEGPYVNRRVYDPLIQATVGMAATQGDLSGRPENVRTIMFDKITSLTAAQAITAALFERTTTGKGQHVPISMMDSALYYVWPDVMWSRTLQGEGASYVGELADYFHVLQTKDGYVSIILIQDDSFQLVSVWRGSEAHLDPRFADLASRIEHREAFIAAMEEMFADVTCQEVCDMLDSFGVPVARVNTLDTVHDDEQVIQQRSLVEVEHPQIGRMRLPRPPAQFEGQTPIDAFPERHAAFIGAHTREILEELGVDEALIAGIEKRDAEQAAQLRAAMAAAAS